MAEILEGLSLSTSEKKQDPQNAYRQQYLMGTAGDMALPHYCSITLPPAKTSQKFFTDFFFLLIFNVFELGNTRGQRGQPSQRTALLIFGSQSLDISYIFLLSSPVFRNDTSNEV